MIKLIINFAIIAVVPFVSKIFKDKKILLNQSGDKHQKFANSSNTPLIGGIFILFSYILFFLDNNIYFSIFVVLIFITGIFSDTKKITSPFFENRFANFNAFNNCNIFKCRNIQYQSHIH